MGHALDTRPLLVRLQKRIEKYEGVTVAPLVTDQALHKQSAEAIRECIKALELVTGCLSRALTAGEVSAAAAGTALVAADEALTKYAIQ